MQSYSSWSCCLDNSDWSHANLLTFFQLRALLKCVQQLTLFAVKQNQWVCLHIRKGQKWCEPLYLHWGKTFFNPFDKFIEQLRGNRRRRKGSQGNGKQKRRERNVWRGKENVFIWSLVFLLFWLQNKYLQILISQHKMRKDRKREFKQNIKLGIKLNLQKGECAHGRK